MSTQRQYAESHLRASKSAGTVEDQLEELRKSVEYLIEAVEKLEKQQK
jgi:hypothetical protein